MFLLNDIDGLIFAFVTKQTHIDLHFVTKQTNNRRVLQ